RRNERLITLNIHNYFSAFQTRRNLCQSISSASMLGACERYLQPSGAHCLNDALVVCGDDRASDMASRQSTLNNPANHGSSSDFQECFARQTSRGETCGNDCDCVCWGIFSRVIHGTTG